MYYVYPQKINSVITACYGFERETMVLSNITFLYNKKVVTRESFSSENGDYPEDAVIDILNIPSEFFDPQVDEEPIPVKKIGSGVLQNIGNITIKKMVIPESTQTLVCGAFNGAFFAKVNEIVLPNTIKKIPSGCFGNSPYLKKVTLPDNVKVIGAEAFSRTPKLENIEIPDSCNLIDKSAFFCSGISNVKFGKNIKSIEKEAFCNCKNLESISWPSLTYEMSDSVLRYCKNLKSINITGNIININYCALSDTGITVLDLTKSAVSPKIASTALPKGVKVVEPYYV